jgi:putative endonuclease
MLSLVSGTMQMKTHFVYVVRCADGSLYTGYTTNVETRMRAHNLGTASKFTRARLPVKLLLVEKWTSKSTALKRELVIKRMTRAQKLQLCRTSSFA